MSEGRITVVDYTVEGDSFHASKPRLWTDKQIGPISGNIPFGLGRLFRPDAGRQAHHCLGAARTAKGSQSGSARDDGAELVRRSAPALTAIWEVSKETLPGSPLVTVSGF
jgi:hypothetical protein